MKVNQKAYSSDEKRLESRERHEFHPVSQSMQPIAPPMSQSRRQRWGRRLMLGAAASLSSLPNWFATYAVGAYAVALLGVSIVQSSYAMEWYFWLFGIIWVAGFFYLSVKYSREWSVMHLHKSNIYEKKLFWTGFWIRIIYVLFIHYFYIEMTGEPYEFQAADAGGYYGTAMWFSDELTKGNLFATLQYYSNTSFSDMGFPLILMFPVRWFGNLGGMLIMRFIHALIGSYTNVLIYRLVRRSMDENTARISAIFCMLHPVLICYAGITLKETIMTWLVVLFIDFGDRLLRNRKYTLGTIGPLLMVGISLFMFRTVLGMIAFLALFFALVMMSGRIVSFGKKFTLGILITGILFMAVSDTIINEVREVTEVDIKEQQESSLAKRYGTEGGKKDGNAFAKYAGVAVFAPLIFTIPFPTMVRINDQEDMRLIHGGNWMRNVMSGFVILAMFMLLLSGDWRKYTLPLAMMLGYLLMLAFTQFAHSLRFHIPVMPFEMMFAAYAITNMRKKHRVWYLYWCLFTIMTCFAWNWFKLAGRGLA